MPDQRVARRTATDLDTLAAQINAEHAACQTALASGLQRAATAGQLLREAKARLSHGQWLPWLQTHFTGSERTAQAYMRVAREGPRLAEENPQRVADLSYRGALQALTAPRPTDSHELRLQQRLDALRAHQAALEADPATQTPEALFAIVEEAEELERDARALGIRATRGMRRLAPTLAPPNLATTSWLLLTLADGGCLGPAQRTTESATAF